MIIINQDHAIFNGYTRIMQENTQSLVECANIRKEYNEKYNAFVEHYSQPKIIHPPFENGGLLASVR
jgi:hypothetical protein